MIHSFDIFDTCLVRLCGTPDSFFDVLSTMAFTSEVDEMTRQEFIIQRKSAERSLWDNPCANIVDIYKAFSYRHPALLDSEELVSNELELERNMLVPVDLIKNEIDMIHGRGENVLFISDMYIPGSIIQDILTSHGLYAAGDKVFVSCDAGARKHDGGLFKYIHDTEGLDYREWTHKGDNRNGDFYQPKKYGIKTVLVRNGYTPIQKTWLNLYHTGCDYSGIIAGISRAFSCSKKYCERRDFILDIIAPLYCSFVYHVLSDSCRQGVKRIFFCARDTYQMYRLALKMQPMFPELEIKYLRISRTALYEGDCDLRMRYFIQEELASLKDKSAIVDSTSSGKTAKVINEELKSNGYLPVCAYYLLKWDDQGIDMGGIQYDATMRQYYFCDCRNFHFTPEMVLMIENFFSTNSDQKTIDYQIGEGGCIMPVFTRETGEQDAMQENISFWQDYEASVLADFSDAMEKTGMFKYASKILEQIAVPTLCRFTKLPNKHYLNALTEYIVYMREIGFVPYVRKESFLRLLRTRGLDSGWKQGTIAYNLPKWLLRWRWRNMECSFWL